MHYLLYKITNKVNDKIYIGVHRTQNINDEYMGSGKLIQSAVKKYGVENFHKEILEVFDNAADMFKREKEIVNEEFLKQENVYNIRHGGSGGFDHINNDAEFRIAKNRKARKATDLVLAEKYGESWRTMLSEKAVEGLRNSPNRRFGFRECKICQQSGNTKAARAKARISQRKTYAITKHQQGEKNSQYGSFWITDGLNNKKCRRGIPEGWRKGRASLKKD